MLSGGSNFLDVSLNEQHHRADFDCGKPSLNHFLHSRVLEETQRGLGRCYVLVSPDQPEKILGYYTLNAHSIEAQLAPNKLGKVGYKEIPSILIGRLAIHQPTQNRGLGSVLLKSALLRCLEVAEQLGVRCVVVDALDEEAKAWYLHKGFQPLKTPQRLYLMIKDIRASLK